MGALRRLCGVICRLMAAVLPEISFSYFDADHHRNDLRGGSCFLRRVRKITILYYESYYFDSP